MPEQHADLFARIRDHCRKQGWYGPDAENPSIYGGDKSDLRTTRFAHPPATEEQRQATEMHLGKPLPPVLRALYATVANGGFGPAYGIVGCRDGFPSNSIERDGLDRTLAATLASSVWRFPVEAARAAERHPDRCIECAVEPDGWVSLCHWGCGIFSDLDLESGHVYSTYVAGRQDAAPIPCELTSFSKDEADDTVICVQFQAASVADWLEKWLRGELRQTESTEVLSWADILHT